MAPTRLSGLAGHPESVEIVLSVLSKTEQVDAVATFLEEFSEIVARREDELELARAVLNFANTQGLLESLRAQHDSNTQLSIVNDAIKTRKHRMKLRHRKQANLNKIQSVKSWAQFPDNLPRVMRTTQKGAPKAFEEKQLARFVTLAGLASYSEALQFFEKYIRDRNSTENVLVEAIAYFEVQATQHGTRNEPCEQDNVMPQRQSWVKQSWVGQGSVRPERAGHRRLSRRLSQRVVRLDASQTTSPTTRHISSMVSDIAEAH